MPLDDYRTLGRSGLVVSPMALGTMTFGTARWGSGETESRAIFDAYVEAGGNVVDTADVYADGRSEEMIGRFVAERGLRDRIVLSTKAGFATGKGRLAGGSGAKHLHAALEGSLSRLKTDHIDLFWLHVWDSVTPAEDVLETMTGFVRSGRIRHWGLSNTPAWFAAKLATLAAVRGVPGPIALQGFYALVNRDIEAEHVPMASEFGMGIMPWSPLAYGLLAGKYDRAVVEASPPRAAGLPRDAATSGQGRDAGDKRLDGANPFGDSLFTDRNWAIVEVVRRIADEIGTSAARVALAWVMRRPGVTSTLMGIGRVEQMADNIAALDLVLAPEHHEALDSVSAGRPRMLDTLFMPAMRRQVVFGGDSVRARPS
ncbi:aldo/keto reductase [Methylobacterium sp. Leaf399]|uniref:aldo/keto reductase n=1 Tax=Methylobacterium sp. Leaf399 TaxID=1736364 RepID=UPI0006F8DB7B|nr:aldo/keto reductase [Methylobacterium sp. Leaf399]KQT07229.1 aldo/keto reductase [Methylobacterium sp. Leaf399]